jgi:hypothetical protein
VNLPAKSIRTTGAAALVIVLLFVPLLVWHAFMLSQIWAWFVAPVFHLPALSIAETVGLLVLLGYVRSTGNSGKHEWTDETTSGQIAQFLGSPIGYTIGFLIAYVAHRFAS